MLSKTEIAIQNDRSLFHAFKVKSVNDGMGKSERVIKKSTNVKLGKRVTKGKLKRYADLHSHFRGTCNMC